MSKAQNQSPATCVTCMGRGTITKTENFIGADEKGIPMKVQTNTVVQCGGCEGKGTK